MRKLQKLLLIIILMGTLPAMAAVNASQVMPATFNQGQFLVLCYHAVMFRPIAGDKYSITHAQFTEQMDYLNTHGYHPVSVQNILDAQAGGKPLPEKAVLLTFDDAYYSYYDFVVPLLKQYSFPSVLAVVGNLFEGTPVKGLPEKIMTWEQIRQVSKSPLVEIASHTYGLHQDIQYNAWGDIGPAVNVRKYFPEQQHYETEAEYIQRLEKDFERQNKQFEEKLGFKPRVIAWPYGKYNSIAWSVAKHAGMRMGLTLEWDLAGVHSLPSTPRVMVENIPVKSFIEDILYPTHNSTVIRALQVDIDSIYDRSTTQIDKNLAKLTDRLVAMKVNRVYLQAFADPDGDGNVDSVYFYNRQLPVRADIFSHTAHNLMIHGIEVYAWMPSLSLIFPDKEFNEKYQVMEKKKGKIRPSQSSYQRLTPFSQEVSQKVGTVFEDLAAYTQIDGILFQDDAYLTDFEDYHPLAMSAYKSALGPTFIPKNDTENSKAAKKWGEYKTQILIDYTKKLVEDTKRTRPEAKFARNLYAEVLTNPDSEAWFAQNYQAFLDNYDEVVVMAYPQMEKARNPSSWLKQLVNEARAHKGLEKTVFKLQAYDWKKEKWLNSKFLLEEMRDVLAAGGIHLAYYPDNAAENEPVLSTIMLEMSTKGSPFER
jgi:poly-beta-1,6-N-acetyl-D-glucosamine N-deacetylase